MLAAHLGRPECEKVKILRGFARVKLAKACRLVKDGDMYKNELCGAERQQYLAPFDALGFDPRNRAPIPPLEFAFVWALHHLNPRDYRADCIYLFGGTEALPGNLEYVTVRNCGEAASVVARLQWSCFARAVRKYEKK